MIRDLNADEIECKVKTVTESGCQLLLYKTARTDAKILDEVYGPMNWRNKYEEIKGNIYCTIELWDSEKKQWIPKQDCGVENEYGDTNNKKKAEASDAFKRAGFKVGIGVELYNSPFIWISKDKLDKHELNNKGKWECKDKFIVSEIKTEDKKIKLLRISNKKGIVYNFKILE